MDYSDIIGMENLLQAWSEFRKGKRNRADVQIFERHLEDNLFALHEMLKSKTYRHGQYQSFYVHDPKLRHIHKAEVSDRVVHHLLYKFLYEVYDKTFIYDSYSCRLGKGTHKAVDRLEKFTRKVSSNLTGPMWALKLDIKKFFASVDHAILKGLLRQKVIDEDILWLLGQIIDSFHSDQGVGKGIPLGNLTSQVLANIYMNELDQFVKHKLKVRYYLRYADDFLILLDEKYYDTRVYHSRLVNLITLFLKAKLKLELHPRKIILRKLSWGIDFLGYIVLPHYRLPRTKTKNRILKKIQHKAGSLTFGQSVQSYLGYLSHANSYRLQQRLRDESWFFAGIVQ